MSVSVFKKPSANPIAQKDVAETFEEAGVSVTQTRTDVADGSVGLLSADGSEVVGDSVNAGTTSTEGYAGWRIDPNTDGITGFRTTLSGYGGDFNSLKVVRRSDFDVLGSVPASPGDTVEVRTNAVLKTSEEYLLAVGTDDSTEVTIAIGDTDTSYPYTSSDFDVPSAYRSGFETTSRGNLIESATALIGHADGEALVEWPEPNDVFRWDAATFQADPDGESVTVDVQESSDGGDSWVTIATDIQRGQELTADPGNRVRFRVSIEREDTSNDPQLGAIYRRWVV